MTPLQQRGYDDQSSGMLNAALAEADTPEGREYREGARAQRRDAEQGLTHCEDCAPEFGCWSRPRDCQKCPVPPPGYIAMNHAPKTGVPFVGLYADGEHKTCWGDMAAGMPIPEGKPPQMGWVEILYGRDHLPCGLNYRGQPIAWKPYPFDPVPDSKQAVPASNPGVVGSNGLGGAFSEPVPGAKRRKAKPVDEGQASLF